MALTHVKYAASLRPINLQYAIPDNTDGKTGIFFSLEKSGLSSCAGGKLQWDFLSLCRAYALQKVHLSPFLPQGHQVHPGTRGCSEPGPRSEPGGAGIRAMGVSAFAWCCDSGHLAEAAVARWLLFPPCLTAEGDFPLPYSLYKRPQLTPALGVDLSSMQRLPVCPHRPLIGVLVRTHQKKDLRS